MFVILALVPFALVAAVLVSNAYARHHLNERLVYWRAETSRLVPPGSEVSTVRAFAAGHGLDLHCNSAITECSARDSAEFGVLPTWHVHLSFQVNQGRVAGSEITPLGVGL